eukprot:1907673-Alexandrium_andersonii.AAC.1
MPCCAPPTVVTKYCAATRMMPAPTCMHAPRLQAGTSLREGSGPQGATYDATHRGRHQLCQPSANSVFPNQ